MCEVSGVEFLLVDAEENPTGLSVLRLRMYDRDDCAVHVADIPLEFLKEALAKV